MFPTCEDNNIVSNDEIYVCGEICSPTELEKGIIYIGGLLNVTSKSTTNHAKREQSCEDSYNILSRSFSSEQPDVVDCDLNQNQCLPRNLFRQCDEDDCTVESDIHVEVCPKCEGSLSYTRDEMEKMVPPYCEGCKTYFIPETLSDHEMIDNLVNSLLRNYVGHNPKGRIEFLAKTWENEQCIRKVEERVRDYAMAGKRGQTIHPSFEDEDRCVGIERISTDEEHGKILGDIKKT